MSSIMSWYSIREYTNRMGVSVSTVRRQIQEGRLFAKKFGGHWYIEASGEKETTEPKMEEALVDFNNGATLAKDGGNIASIVEFSSKALHHYLLMSEKLLAEKDSRLAEKSREVSEKQQAIAELEKYAELLEAELAERRGRP
jgi:excisionase family DNA binding protein